MHLRTPFALIAVVVALSATGCSEDGQLPGSQSGGRTSTGQVSSSASAGTSGSSSSNRGGAGASGGAGIGGASTVSSSGATAGIADKGGSLSESASSSGGRSSTGGISSGKAGDVVSSSKASGGDTSGPGGTSTGTGGSGRGGTTASGGVTSAGGTGTSAGSTGGGTGTAGSTGSNSADRSPGCGKTPTIKSGNNTLSGRQYIIRIPSNYDNNKAYRLIFGFHWLGGTMQDVDTGQTVTRNVWSYYGLQQLDTEKTAIFVAPQGNGNGWGNANGADLTFVDNMLKAFQEDFCIDTKQIFSLGFSFGGGMSYALACARAKVFRAVAIYDGGVLSGCTGGQRSHRLSPVARG